LQDTTKFLKIINAVDNVPENAILFTVDVTSLYAVLPHDHVINYVLDSGVERYFGARGQRTFCGAPSPDTLPLRPSLRALNLTVRSMSPTPKQYHNFF
jgi:hypothetical protein